MKKKLALLLGIVMTMTAFAGCSKASTTSSAGTNSSAKTPDWPKKTINFYVTHAAGGDTDYNARLLGRLLEKKLGVSVAVNNVTGSNGAICLTQYKDAKPDGYTFVLTNTAALSGNEATGLSDFGYNAFEPVSIYGKQSGENIIVPANSPYKTLQDLIDASKAKPDSIKFGISTGGGVYIASVILAKSGGAQFKIVESGDAAPRMTALLGGHVDATDVPYAIAKEYIESGKVRSLCTLLKEKPTLIPNIPTASESGVKDLVINTLYTALAPKGTDPAVVKAMNDAILDIVKNNPDYKTEVNKYNLQDPWALNVEDTKKELEAQRQLFMGYSNYLKK